MTSHGDYETHRSLKESAVPVDGVDLTVLTDVDSAPRLPHSDFSMSEVR